MHAGMQVCRCVCYLHCTLYVAQPTCESDGMLRQVLVWSLAAAAPSCHVALHQYTFLMPRSTSVKDVLTWVTWWEWMVRYGSLV